EAVMSNETVYTPKEAASYLRTSTSTLAKRRIYGSSPKFCRIGRAIRYRKCDLDEYLASTCVSSTSEKWGQK
ncbi:MAG: helix-turn-helix domain-containing protein, partial [Afipia sp.]|nr:helix-turn-helix domain-containing protein [Afipia sp.]